MIPTRIGQQCNGGAFAGVHRIKNQFYSLIVSHTIAESTKHCGSLDFPTRSATSTIDGYANTELLCSISKAANYCEQLSFNSYSDWYMPSIHELAMCYKYFASDFKEHPLVRHKGAIEVAKLSNTSKHSVPATHLHSKKLPFSQMLLDAQTRKKFKFSQFCYCSSTRSIDVPEAAIICTFRDGMCRRTYESHFTIVRPVRRELIVKIP